VEQRLRLLERTVERRLAPARQALDFAAGRLERAAVTGVERRRSQLATLSARLDALSPLSTLARGYAVATSPAGELLRSVADFPAGRAFRLRVSDGTVAAHSKGPVE
jgi:exodeoxyribonuclease VII large subunit